MNPSRMRTRVAALAVTLLVAAACSSPQGSEQPENSLLGKDKQRGAGGDGGDRKDGGGKPGGPKATGGKPLPAASAPGAALASPGADGKGLTGASRTETEISSTGEDPRTALMGAAAAGAAGGETLVLSQADGAVPYEDDYGAGEDEESPWRAILTGALIGLLLLALAIGAYAMLSDDSEPQAERREGTGTERSRPPTSATPSEEEAVIVPEEPSSPAEPSEPSEEPAKEEEDSDEEDDEVIEGETGGEIDSKGQGPDGEGPPGQEKKEEG